LKRFYRSRYLPKKIIETDQSFFLLLSLVKVTVHRSRYGIELKNGMVKSFPLLCFLKKWNGYVVLITRPF
jgi:hypothetical protein